MEVNKHIPGTFCWVELGTTDQAAAKTFYSTLFGWGIEDMPMGPDSYYTMLKLKGKDVAALYQLSPEQTAQGVPPHWLPYVATENANETANAIVAAGGKLMMEPFDVFDAGRMAVAQDPAGASVAIWQPHHHIGVGIHNENDAFCWAELATTDAAVAKDFYGKAFGWRGDTKDVGPMPYTEFFVGNQIVGGQIVGGMLEMPPEWGQIPPHWMVYFAVADCDAVTAKAESLGAKICAPPSDIPNVGRFAVLLDPQGATFSVIALFQQA